jgi:hypothetical protein
MTEANGFFASQDDDLAGAFGESLEHTRLLGTFPMLRVAAYARGAIGHM